MHGTGETHPAAGRPSGPPGSGTLTSGGEAVPWGLRIALGPGAVGDFDPIPLVLEWLGQLCVPQIILSSVFVVVSELLTNAVDHGILDLDSSIKDEPDGFAAYLRLRAERLASLASGFVVLEVERIGGALRVRVQDSGGGFDHAEIPAIDAYPRRRWGRGIALVKRLCCSVEFFGAGNCVEAHFPLQRPLGSDRPLECGAIPASGACRAHQPGPPAARGPLCPFVAGGVSAPPPPSDKGPAG